ALSVMAGNFRRHVITWWPDPDPTIFREPALWLIAALLAVGLAAVRRVPAGWVLPAWLVLPLLTGLRAAEAVYPHYLLALVPTGAALAGLGAAWLPSRTVAMPLLAVIVLLRMAD